MVFYILIFSSFLLAVCNYIVNISIPLYLTEVLNASRFQTGIAGFSGNFGYTLSTLLLSKVISENFLFFIFSPFLIGISYLSLPLTQINLFFCIMFFVGIFYSRFWPFVQKCFRNSPEKLIGYFNLAWSSGIIAGCYISGFIYSLNRLYPFFISGILCMLIGIVLLIKRKDIGNLDWKIDSRKIETVYKNVNIGDIRTLNFLNFFTTGVILFIFPRYALELNFKPQIISQIVAVFLFTRFFTFFFLRSYSFILHRNLIFVSSTVFLIVYLLLISGKFSFFLLSFFIFGVLSAVLYHNSILVHVKGGYKTEIHEGIVGIGFLSGSFISGLLSQIFNFKISFLVIGVCFLLSGFLLTIFRSNSQQFS